ncbi:MAG: hypothetical protein WBE12_03900 [Candidatus Acidiferrum sp.]
MIDGLQRLVVQLEGDSSLAERNQLRRRLEALDRLDAYFPDTAEAGFGAESTERELYRRARAVCARLEAANEELYEAIRCEIRRGSRPESLLRWVPAAEGIKDVGGPANGVGYDFLDELIRGVFPFEEPGAGHNARDPEKVFYQPTPARHIFRLIELTTLTARDVFVDLGSGLGHVSMLASICTDARSMGIELEAGYVECARRCAQKLNLNAVTFVQEDARVADLTSGTVFYLYTPFKGSILRRVLDRLKCEAASRRIRICSYGLCTSVIAEEPWLEAATTPEARRITLFCSRD